MCYRTGFDPMFPHRRWLQKLSIKVQVLNGNLVATCMPDRDAYLARPATRKAGTSVQRAVTVWQSQMGGHTLSLVRNTLAFDRHLVTRGIRYLSGPSDFSHNTQGVNTSQVQILLDLKLKIRTDLTTVHSNTVVLLNIFAFNKSYSTNCPLKFIL